MRLRLVIAGLCCALLAAVALTAAVADRYLAGRVPPVAQGPSGFIAPYQEYGEAPWLREQAFLVYQNYLRFGEGPEIAQSQFPQPAHPNPDRVKVLVIGDSFIWGHGIVDTDMRWPELLERALNDATAPGTFEVTAFGSRGLSTLGQSQVFTAERFDAVDPDVVVLGYGENDPIPSGYEDGLCATGAEFCREFSLESLPVYHDCIAGRSGGVAGFVDAVVRPLFTHLAAELSRRACSSNDSYTTNAAIRYNESLADPTKNPYWHLFVDAASTLRTAVGDRPAVVVATPTDFFETANTKALQVLRDAGWEVAATPRTTRLGAATRDRSVFHVMPVDRHPSAVLTTVYAADTAEHLLSTLDRARVERARGGATRPAATLISNTMPVTVTVTGDTGRSATVAYTRPDRSTVFPFTTMEGRSLPDQFVPCASAGRPFVQVMLDATLPAGTRVAVALRTTEPVQLSTYGYDRTGRVVETSVGALDPGKSLTVTTGNQVTGLRFAAGAGCSLDQVLDMVPFTAELTARRP
jgi:lysophospholipase L1-like esterase